MKRSAWSLAAGLGIAGLVVVAAVARGGDSDASRQTSNLGYPDVVYQRDTVKSVDTSSKQMTLASGKTVPMSDDCKVMMHGKPASVSDVKEGAQIRAAMSGKGESRKVVEIWILGAPATSTGSGASSGAAE